MCVFSSTIKHLFVWGLFGFFCFFFNIYTCTHTKKSGVFLVGWLVFFGCFIFGRPSTTYVCGCVLLVGTKITSNAIFPHQVTWNDIAGLDDVITDLKDTVILPIKKKYLFENSRLLQPPKGSKDMLWVSVLVLKKQEQQKKPTLELLRRDGGSGLVVSQSTTGLMPGKTLQFSLFHCHGSKFRWMFHINYEAIIAS